MSGNYGLKVLNHSLIPMRNGFNEDDFLADASSIAIENDVLRLQLNLFLSAGGWTAGARTFKFRFQEGEFRLIGFDSEMVHRGSGETDSISINFLSGKAKVSKGSIESDILKTEWTKISNDRLLSLDEVGDGWAYKPPL